MEIALVVAAGRLPVPTGLIEDDLLPAPAAMATGRRVTELHINARFARRGRKLLPPPRIVVSDPFGLATRVVVADEPAEVLVLPRIEPVVTPPGEGDGSGLVARRGRPSIAAEVDLDGLRPYRVGAAASRIFWPGLARGGELMERRLRADGDTRPLVVLDPRRPAREEDLDAAVRAAASLCVHLARAGGCALLLPGDRRPTDAGGDADRLAAPARAPGAHRRAQRPQRGRPGVAPRPAAVRHRPRPVAGAARPRPRGRRRALPDRPRRQPATNGNGQRSGRRAVFTVAGCTGYELSGARRRVAEVA